MAALAALPLPRGHRIERVVVVMPAHNEEEHLEPALQALQQSADALHRVRPDVLVRVTVVLDSCTDGSAAIAAGFAAADPRVSVLTVGLPQCRRQPGRGRPGRGHRSSAAAAAGTA